MCEMSGAGVGFGGGRLRSQMTTLRLHFGGFIVTVAIFPVGVKPRRQTEPCNMGVAFTIVNVGALTIHV